MTEISKIRKLTISSNKNYEIFSFYFNGEFQTNFPIKWGITLKKAGSMRFRWNEENNIRKNIFSEILTEQNLINKEILPVELIHSKEILIADKFEDCKNIQKDGIITQNKNLIPTVTVADCVPIYFCDFKQNIFGVVHSGWKGTGIIEEAVLILQKNFNSKAENISVVIGPHIKNCCYIVDSNRAEYFTENFGSNCIKEFLPDEKLKNPLIEIWKNQGSKLFRLSLLNANLNILQKLKIRPKNILICENCTCCDEIFGSNRRETAILQKKQEQFDKNQAFTVQAAFIYKN